MNQQHLDIFLNRYGARADYVQPHRSYMGYHTSYEQYEYQRGTVELELPMDMLQRLVHLDRACQDLQDEAEIRRRSPAVANAYDQYQIMLALYR